jgi:putative membrane protein
VRFLTWLVTHALALAAAAWLLDGIRFAGPRHGAAEVTEKLLPLLAVALILGLVSATVKPLLKLLSLPFILLTLGLFLLVINAAMLGLTGWLADGLGLGFRVHGFWTAVGGGLVITVVTWLVDRLVGSGDRVRR